MESKKQKINKQTFAIALVLIVLAVIAAVVAIASSNKDDVPTISDDMDTEESTAASLQTDAPDTTAEETQAPVVPEEPEKFYNPLTGLECSEEISKQRPVAIMINNIHLALPQEGVSKADVVYECLAEGGITRLMMLAQDYKSLGQTGSIRSSRDYYLDFAQNHDAIYFHAGGSTKAYSEIASRGINNCDGIYLEGSSPVTFFRDSWRRNNFAYEHTMVITGEGIVNAISMKNYRTELKDGFKSPFNFAEEAVTLEGNDASCVYLPFSYYQAPYLKYDSTTNTYKRWQYNEPHADKDGTQLQFENIIVLFCYHTGPLDSYNRIEVTTTGSGEGYYINGGKYIEIKYNKPSVDSPVELYNTDGTPLEINTGKTYIAIFNQANKTSIDMNYNK